MMMKRLALLLLQLGGSSLLSAFGFSPVAVITTCPSHTASSSTQRSSTPLRVEQETSVVTAAAAAAAINETPAVAKNPPANVDTLTPTTVHNDDNKDDGDNDNDNTIVFTTIARRAMNCLIQSGDKQHHTTDDWILQDDDARAALQQTLDKVCFKVAAERNGIDRDEALTWIRWMKSTPTPLIVDLSNELQTVALLNDNSAQQHDDEVKNRLKCRLICLPSGASLVEAFQKDESSSSSSSSIIYGKLLYGSITRRHTTTNKKRRRRRRRQQQQMEEQTETASIHNNVPAWRMDGPSDRTYEAMDLGAAAILEIVLEPPLGLQESTSGSSNDDMTLSRLMWNPQKMFSYVKNDDDDDGSNTNDDTALLGNVASALSGKSRNEAFKADFQSSVGGLQPQIDSIVRRVLDGRIIRPAHVVDNNNNDNNNDEDETTVQLAMASSDAEELELLGLTPVRGLLLYGPPGCGKTALAREISRALQARAPKIVSAPELLDRWVGGSERLVRELFLDAESELAACNGDASQSALHVVVIDEIDAVFRKRSGGEDSGEATRASAVNQILAKLDGVNAIPNVLLIGMTNRRELLDGALLRPGRLEVQVEIPLPDTNGRREILRIHFKALRDRGRLSMPLCRAIDGSSASLDEKMGASKEHTSLARRMVKRLVMRSTYDLAAVTAGFSGADLAGLVRCSGSLALSRARRDGSGVEGLLITLDDVKEALKEVEK